MLKLTVSIACLVISLTATQFLHAHGKETTGNRVSRPLSGYGHDPTDPKDNFISPFVKTVLRSQYGDVSAVLTTETTAFPVDGCQKRNRKAIGCLNIYKDGKLAAIDMFAQFDCLTNVTGPQLIPNKNAPPTVAIDILSPDEHYRYYDFVPSKGTYRVRVEKNTEPEKTSSKRRKSKQESQKVAKTPEESDKAPEPDDTKKPPVIEAERSLLAGDFSARLTWNSSFENLNNGGENFKLELKKFDRPIWSDKVQLETAHSGDEPGTEIEKNRAVECFGPIIVKGEGVKNSSILLRCSMLVLDKNGREDKRNYDFVFSFDDKTDDCNQEILKWGSWQPHLADIERDRDTEFITEDWKLANALWLSGDSVIQPEGRKPSGEGGPLQIWSLKDHGRIVNETRKYPKEIKRHADCSLAQFNAESTHPECYLLGYIGDLLLLGEKEKALAELKRLDTPNTVKEHDRILEQFKKHGYL